MPEQGAGEIEMPERCFCWFDKSSSTVNRGVSIFSVSVCAHACGGTFVSVKVCESERDTEKCGRKKNKHVFFAHCHKIKQTPNSISKFISFFSTHGNINRS